MRCSSLYYRLVGCLCQWNVVPHGASALFWAAEAGSIGTLERFLDAGLDLRWQCWFQSHMRTSVRRDRINRVPSAADAMRDHPICHAAANGHGEFVQRLLEQGVDINFKDDRGTSPLALAARHGHLGLVQMLISLGAQQLSYDA
jgi:hypothetical protein